MLSCSARKALKSKQTGPILYYRPLTKEEMIFRTWKGKRNIIIFHHINCTIRKLSWSLPQKSNHETLFYTIPVIRFDVQGQLEFLPVDNFLVDKKCNLINKSFIPMLALYSRVGGPPIFELQKIRMAHLYPCRQEGHLKCST